MIVIFASCWSTYYDSVFVIFYFKKTFPYPAQEIMKILDAFLWYSHNLKAKHIVFGIKLFVNLTP